MLSYIYTPAPFFGLDHVRNRSVSVIYFVSNNLRVRVPEFSCPYPIFLHLYRFGCRSARPLTESEIFIIMIHIPPLPPRAIFVSCRVQGQADLRALLDPSTLRTRLYPPRFACMHAALCWLSEARETDLLMEISSEFHFIK